MEEIWDRTNMLRIYPKVRTIPPVVLVAYRPHVLLTSRRFGLIAKRASSRL